MISEKVIQKTTFICDKCKKSKTVETELEEYQGKYDKIDEYIPEGFHEIEELHTVLCNDCYKELKSWIKKEDK